MHSPCNLFKVPILRSSHRRSGTVFPKLFLGQLDNNALTIAEVKPRMWLPGSGSEIIISHALDRQISVGEFDGSEPQSNYASASTSFSSGTSD